MPYEQMTILPWISDLYQISQAASGQSGAVRTEQRVLEGIVSGFGGDSGCLAMHDTDIYDQLVIVAGVGLPDGAVGCILQSDEEVLGRVAGGNMPQLLNGDVPGNARCGGQAAGNGSRSTMCWPLKLPDRSLGALVISRGDGKAPFTQEDLDRGSVIASMAALVIENLHLHRNYRERVAVLTESEARFQVTFDQAAVGVTHVGPDGRFLRVNQKFSDILGYSCGELLQLGYLDITCPEDMEYNAVLHRELEQGQRDSYALEKRYIRKDGSRVWVNASVSMVRVDEGKTKYAIGIIEDITERKQAEEALQSSEERFHAAFEQAGVGMAMRDLDPRNPRWLRVNQKMCDMLGYTREELLQLTYVDITPHEERGKSSLLNEKLVRGEIPGFTREKSYLCKDGQLVQANITLSVVRGPDGKPSHIMSIVEDISERKRAEADLKRGNESLKAMNTQLKEMQGQLLQSEKMASIGQLAAGVAHEINNPIGYVYSNLGTLQKYVEQMFGVLAAYESAEGALAPGALEALSALKQKADLEFLREDVGSLMNESREGITRVKKIVQDLKDFSHVDSQEEWQWADLHKGLDSTLNIVNNEIKYKAQVVKRYGKLPEIRCLPSQLNQVFMNLLVNASHAIEEQGEIRLSSGVRGEEVWMEVADTGKGIAPEHLGRIFDPFFTTKAVGKGTGLGLSLSYGIVQKHHGRIEVASEPGKGATFRVWLPVNHVDAKKSVDMAVA